MRLTLLLVAVALLVPAAAHASGGGLGSTWGGQGATAPGRAFTYVALPSGKGALIGAVQRRGGEVARWRHLPRQYAIPQAAYDGSTTGLSADGHVLVLLEIQARFPIRRTRVLVLDATTLATIERFSFPGRYGVCALSPHGRYVYLRRSTAPLRDPSRSELVVLDRGRPGAPVPITRPASAYPMAHVSDGRHAFTYFQGTAANWVQALDTVTRRIRRYDAPRMPTEELDLRLDGDRLHVGGRAMINVG